MSLFDELLKRIRSSGKPLHVIAMESGVSYHTLQKWTRGNGVRNPRLSTVEPLMKYFAMQQSAPKRAKVRQKERA
jgi:transcriptional regulator with XRE-family HTH domain